MYWRMVCIAKRAVKAVETVERVAIWANFMRFACRGTAMPAVSRYNEGRYDFPADEG